MNIEQILKQAMSDDNDKTVTIKIKKGQPTKVTVKTADQTTYYTDTSGADVDPDRAAIKFTATKEVITEVSL